MTESLAKLIAEHILINMRGKSSLKKCVATVVARMYNGVLQTFNPEAKILRFECTVNMNNTKMVTVTGLGYGQYAKKFVRKVADNLAGTYDKE